MVKSLVPCGSQVQGTQPPRQSVPIIVYLFIILCVHDDNQTQGQPQGQ